MLEVLEDRLALSAFTWKGTVSKDWSTGPNWERTSGDTGAYPGENGSRVDEAYLEGGADRDAELNENVTVSKLTLRANFNKALVVKTGKALTAKNADVALLGGTLNFENNA